MMPTEVVGLKAARLRAETGIRQDYARPLCLADDSPGATGRHRAAALTRSGHHVDLLDPASLLRRGWVIDRMRARSGYRSSRNGIARALERELTGRRYDAVWVGGDESSERQPFAGCSAARH